MLYGDKNMSLLICNDKIIVNRLDSTIVYDTKSLNKDIAHTSLKFPRSFNGRIYDYFGNKMTSYTVLANNLDGHEASAQKSFIKEISSKEFQLGNIKDFFKHEKTFFFIKSSKNSAYSLFFGNSTSQSILDFSCWYCFSKNYIFIVADQELIKMNLETMEKEHLMKLKIEPVMLTCKACTDDGDLIAVADRSNKIHIFCGETHRQYHWLSKKAESMSFYDDFIVVASKDGKLAKFHTKIHKIQMLCDFVGSFVDLKVENNNIYLLTDIQFLIFSLETENLVFSELLMPVADFSIVKFEISRENDKDVFNLKKQSRVEVHNCLGNFVRGHRTKKTQASACDFSIGFANENHVFLFDPFRKKFSNFFSLESNINFISRDRVFNICNRRKDVIIKVFTIAQDCLALEKCVRFSSNEKLNIKKIFSIKDKIFFVSNNTIYRINKLNLIEEIKNEVDPTKIKEIENSGFVIDDKGIYDIYSKSYVVKQKKIVDFIFFRSMLIFYIESRGFYIDTVERKLLLEINGVIDIQKIVSFNEEAGENAEYLSAIYLDNGKYFFGVYDLDEDKSLKLVRKSSISSNCHKILADGIFSTKTGQMIFQPSNL